jgi:Family of unknown function (DUF5906)
MDNDPKKDEIKRLNNDDDLYPNAEQISNFPDSPAFDPKAHPHLYFLGQATSSIEAGKIDHFRDPENLKKFRAVKDYAASDEKHAAHVQGELDKLMERLKKHTNSNDWFQTLLKAIDEYVDTSGAPTTAGDRPAVQEKQAERVKARQAINNQQVIAELRSCKTKRDVLDVMNKYHSYVIDGGKARIYREVNKYIQSIEISAFRGWCANKSVPITSADPDGKTETKYIKLYDYWYTHPDRFEYTSVDFDPSKTFDRNDRSNDVHNMWRDWETEGKKGPHVKDILRFIYEIICNKNMGHFYWVMSWIADLIQNPADPKGVALVLIGPKGIGKTFFGELICSLVGDKYSFITANKDDIFGDFNGHLSNLMFMVYEEAVWAQNRQIEAILKVFITGKRRSSQAKYHDTKMINNYIRSLILANPGWAVPVSLDDRRYMILNPSVDRMKDFEYFGGLLGKLNDGGREALMYFLKRYRIGRGGIDIRSAPKTEGFYDQQRESLEPFESWLLEELLWTGVVICCYLGADSMQVQKSKVYEQYLEWWKRMDARGKKLSSKQFGIKFGSYFPTLNENGTVKKSKNGRIISIFTDNDTTNNESHLYTFPSLAETRRIVLWGFGRVEPDYWEGGAIVWEAHEDSAHSLGAPPVDGAKVDAIIEGKIIPMRGGRRES